MELGRTFGVYSRNNKLQAAGVGRQVILKASTHLELCHLLLQVKDELLYPGVIGLIVIEFFLLSGSKGVR